MSGQANFWFDGMDSLAARRSLRKALAAPDVCGWLIEQKIEERRARVRTDRILQAAILVLSLAAVYLITSPGPYTKWGHVVGLASQPFWIAATWRARQWGMLVLSIAYSGLWLRGIVNYF